MVNGGTAEGGDTLKDAIELASEVGEPEAEQGVVTFATGIQLRFRPINRQLILQAIARINDPEPPMVDIGKGREEPFPDDPAYQLELARLRDLRIEVSGQATAVLGTEIAFVPDGMFRPEDDGWMPAVEQLNELMPAEGKQFNLDVSTRSKRYLSWLNYYAISGAEDEGKFSALIVKALGVTSEEVAASMATFRRDEGRDGDRGVSDTAAAADGDRNPPAAPRPSRAVRRARGG